MLFGIQLGGFSVMPINTKLATPEVEYIFNQSEAKALIYDVRIEQVINEIDHVFQEKLTINGGELLGGILEDTFLEFSPVQLNANDTAVVMYTSGTTGKPKGVMLTHQNILASGEIWSEAMDVSDSDRMLVSTPLFHCAASHVSLYR